MGILILLALLAVPILELWVIVQVAQGVGVPETLGLLILVSVVGAWLLKQQGMATWRRLQSSLSQGQVPTKEVTDGALILFGGALLLTPGFVSDAVGLLLLLPPTRAVLKGIARRHFARRAQRLGGRSVYTGRVVRVQRNEPPGPTPLESGGDDSPDKE